MAEMVHTFYLFRTKVIVLPQATLLGQFETRQKTLREAIESSPQRRGGTHRVTWHIGNAEDIGESRLYFRIGKTTRTIESQFDPATKDFLDNEVPIAPYSHAVIDLAKQVCGITPNTKLASTAAGIGRHLELLLNESNSLLNHGIAIHVVPIADPAEFVSLVNEAYKVTTFSFEVNRPNPFDANKDFQRPLERYVDAINGNVASTTVMTNDDLDREIVSELSRAAAASGNKASVRVLETPESKATLKSLGGNPAQVQTGDLDSLEAKRAAAAKVIREYLDIRQSNSNLDQT